MIVMGFVSLQEQVAIVLQELLYCRRIVIRRLRRPVCVHEFRSIDPILIDGKWPSLAASVKGVSVPEGSHKTIVVREVEGFYRQKLGQKNCCAQEDRGLLRGIILGHIGCNEGPILVAWIARSLALDVSCAEKICTSFGARCKKKKRDQ